MIVVRAGRVRIQPDRKKSVRLTIPSLPRVWMRGMKGAPKRPKDFPPRPLLSARFARGYRKGID